jgi:hypothetical protein
MKTPSRQRPVASLRVGHVEADDGVEVVPLKEVLRLPPIPREPVEDEPIIPIVLLRALTDDPFHEGVIDEPAGRHGLPHACADLGVVADMSPEDVPGADPHEIEVAGRHGGVGALTAPQALLPADTYVSVRPSHTPCIARQEGVRRGAARIRSFAPREPGGGGVMAAVGGLVCTLHTEHRSRP